MLVHFDPAAMCDLHETDLILAPLPAKKQLWEAGDELAWKAKSEREPGVRTIFGLAGDGELVRLDESQPDRNDATPLNESLDYQTPLRSAANWEEWCAGMDGLGGLVMLAAALMS